MKVEVKWDPNFIKNFEKAVKDSAVEALEAVHSDLKESKTMPFDTGELQEKQTFVDETAEGARLVHGIIYSRYLYYGLHMVDAKSIVGPMTEEMSSGNHRVPDPRGTKLKFRQTEGATGTRGSHWLEPYISGDKKDFVKTEFAKALEKRLGSK